MSPPVRITFDCVPLRSIGRLDIPIDASPDYRARCERIKQALEKHGSHNSYYLTGAECAFQLTNHETVGRLVFSFEGTVLTDTSDLKTKAVDLEVELASETCDWLTKPVVDWFVETVRRALAIEFDRYIAAGDLARTIERLEAIQNESDQAGGYFGMHV